MLVEGGLIGRLDRQHAADAGVEEGHVQPAEPLLDLRGHVRRVLKGPGVGPQHDDLAR
jgi:hypothetical protein